MFRIYQKYILRKIVIVSILSVVVISMCLVSLNLLKLIKAARHLLSFRMFITAVGYFNLFILAFSVPLSILIASLLVFGKMSAENEITALRASGIRMSQISLPPLIFSILVSFSMLYINGVVSPEAHYNVNQLKFLSGAVNPMKLFSPRVSSHIGQYTIFIDRIEGNKMFGLSIMEDTPERSANITARIGELDHTPGESKFTLNLYDAEVSMRTKEGTIEEHDRVLSIELDIAKVLGAFRKRKTVDDLTMKELIIRRDIARNETGYTRYVEGMKILELLRKPAPGEDKARRRHLSKLSQAAGRVRNQDEEYAKIKRSYLFEIHKRLVLSISCFAFTAMAVPLGIRIHRRERTLNVLIGVLIAFLYYAVIIIVEKSGQIDVLRPHLLIWIPPITCTALGARLLYGLRRGA